MTGAWRLAVAAGIGALCEGKGVDGVPAALLAVGLLSVPSVRPSGPAFSAGMVALWSLAPWIQGAAGPRRALLSGAVGLGVGLAEAALRRAGSGSSASRALALGAAGAMGMVLGVGFPARVGVGLFLGCGLLRYVTLREDEQDDRVALVFAAMAGLLGVSGGVRPEGVLLAAILAVSWPLAWRGLEARRRSHALPWGALAVFLAMALAVFVAAPRPPKRRAPEPPRVGFGVEVALDDLAPIRDDPSVVFEARFTPGVTGPVYFRGIGLDAFDGQTWKATAPRAASVGLGELSDEAPVAGAVMIEIDQVATSDGALFLPGNPLKISATAERLEADGWDSWSVPGGEALGYAMWTTPPFGPGAGPSRRSPATRVERLTQLPEGLGPQVLALAESWGGEGGGVAVAERIASRLKGHASYARVHPKPGVDPIIDLLYGDRVGHCEVFASALVVLLRSRGIPALVVTGFVAWPEGGEATVRGSQAHAWVEVYDEGGAWTVIEATPGPPPAVSDPGGAWTRGQESLSGWFEAFEDYDGSVQISALSWFGAPAVGLVGEGSIPGALWGALVVGVVGGGLARAGYWWLNPRLPSRRPAPGSRGRIAALHDQARQVARSRGWLVPPGLPPIEAARWLRSRAPGEAPAALEALAWLHYRVRFGGEDEGPLVGEAEALARTAQGIGPWQPPE